jgi:hypothetical protein
VKEFAQRQRPQISLVGSSPARRPEEAFDYGSLRRSFDGWLNAVALPEEEQSVEDVATENVVQHTRSEAAAEIINLSPVRSITSRKKTPVEADLARLNTQDFIEVSLVTVRESFRQRFWPEWIVSKFLAAEIIRVPQVPIENESGDVFD